MPNNSTRTSYFGPLVSFRTTKSHEASAVYVYGDSNSSLGWDGPVTLGGTVTASGAVTASGTVAFDLDAILSTSTSLSLVTATMTDTQLSVMSVNGLSAYLAYRSGNTVYEWLSTSTSN